MRSQLSLLQMIGLFLSYASAFFLVSMIDSPFGATPFWIVAAALAVFLTGNILSLLGRRFTPKFTLTRLQWLGLGLLALVLFLGAFLLSTHGTHMREAIPIATAIVIVTAQLCLGRPQTSSQKK
jgi:peptidoglycan/LPS O-acetylase OafA/YrhL